jgi:CRISPR type I-E-associated protein CasB/Cse2
MHPSSSITAQEVREARARYDALSPEEKAALARCPDAQAITMDRTFWKIAASSSDEVRLRLAHLVACFPSADQLDDPTGFRTGTFLREVLHPGAARVEPAQAVRYRQLIAARDVDELVPRMRRLLADAKRPVDWGVLGRDMFNWSERIRKTWSQDFYGPQA